MTTTKRTNFPQIEITFLFGRRWEVYAESRNCTHQMDTWSFWRPKLCRGHPYEAPIFVGFPHKGTFRNWELRCGVFAVGVLKRPPKEITKVG